MRDLLRLGGVLVLITGMAFVAGRSWSDTKTPPAPKTKVAIFNLRQVIETYPKYLKFQEEFTKMVRPYTARDEALSKRARELEAKYKGKELGPREKEDLTIKMKALQQQREENKETAQKRITDAQEAQMKELYADVESAAKRYAKDHDIELLMHYNDAFKAVERTAPANVARKMQAGSLVPVHAAPGIDITERLKKMLADEYGRSKPKKKAK